MKLKMTLMTAVALSVLAGAAMAADPTEKWCAGVKIAAFPGGPPTTSITAFARL